MYDVTFRCVRVTTVAVEKQYVSHILSACVCLQHYVPRMQSVRAS
jgi:hypothetical protein